MNNYPQISRKYFIVAGVVILAIIIVAIISLFSLSPQPTSPRLQIVNLAESLKDIPDDITIALREQLYDELTATYYLKDDVVIDDAEIRPNTAQFSTDNSGSVVINSATFLIDIPSFEQTYRVALYYPDGSVAQNPISYPVVFSCPTTSETNYPNSSCYIHNTTGVDK